MKHVTDHTRVNASPDTLWSYVTDPENFGDYVAGYASGRVVSENTVGEGATYDWKGSFGPIRLSCTERVVEWKAGERVAYEGELAGVHFRSSMEVAPAEGGSELTVGIGCVKKTCAELGVTCGQSGDGCGGIIDCGPCGGPSCTPLDCGGRCGPQGDGCGGVLSCEACPLGSCIPTTCLKAAAQCGFYPDGCGSGLDCGTCATGESCINNKCVTIK